MSYVPFKVPVRLPSGRPLQSVTGTTLDAADSASLYDVAIGGVGFEFANTVDNPYIRETVPLTKERVDQAVTPGEQTLTGWWIKSQDSFHGGAGQLQLEQPTGETPVTHVRYDCSKKVNPFVPGMVTPLPDVTVLTGVEPTKLCALVVSGADALAYLAGGVPTLMTAVTTAPSATAFAGGVSTGQSMCTDGRFVYAATATTVYRYDPTTPAAAPVTVATFPTATDSQLAWVKSRLMLGANGSVYEITDLSGANPGSAATLRYTHPTPGFSWQCFANGPQALLAAGNANGGPSVITSFTLNNQANFPILAVAGDIGEMPNGETILSMMLVEGSFLAIGTTRGVRVGTYDAYYQRLQIGPLHLSTNDPVNAVYALATRDRFIYAAGKDYDEAGLLCLDTGTVTDQAGRFAWAPHQVTPTFTQNQNATSVAVLPLSQRLAFGVTGQGLYLEGTTPGTQRETWLRTSRIRFGTAEPKLFKLGRVRGYFPSGQIDVTGITPDGSVLLASVGWATSDPDEFRLATAQSEWLQLKFTLSKSSTVQLNNYSVKALPATRRQRYIQLVLALFDNETTKTGQRIRDELGARTRLNKLEAMDAAGDEVAFQEFTPAGVVSTVVVIDKVSFKQSGRPQARSDIGGTVNVLLRTVES